MTAEFRDYLAQSVDDLYVSRTLACAIGLNAAIFLRRLKFWLDRNEEINSGNHYQDGRWWAYNTYQEWTDDLKVLSNSTVRRAINHVEALGIVLSTSKYNKHANDDTKWYSVDCRIYEDFMTLWQAAGCPNGNTLNHAYREFLEHWLEFRAINTLVGLLKMSSPVAQDEQPEPEPADHLEQPGGSWVAQGEQPALDRVVQDEQPKPVSAAQGEQSVTSRVFSVESLPPDESLNPDESFTAAAGSIPARARDEQKPAAAAKAQEYLQIKSEVEKDPLWQAYAGVWEIAPGVPDGKAVLYLETIIALRDVYKATPDDVAELTRLKLQERAALEKQGYAHGPYFFNYLAPDFYQLRQRQPSQEEPWKKYTTGRYAAFINNFDRNEPAPDESGQEAPAAKEPALVSV